MWVLPFISEQDFYEHVKATINKYGEKLITFDLKRFNKNIIDPIKLIFDKNVYGFTWDEIIKNEIFRQRDKSNNNEIGYFHQRIFQYMQDCEVPQSGWDVIFSPKSGIKIDDENDDKNTVRRVFVEMKNKHNTMNSSSSGKTYIKMQHQLLEDGDCACFLVEAIAKKSQNIPWSISVDGKQKKHQRIRRVSMDEFYSLVTGQEDAFYQICMQLPKTIEKVISEMPANTIPHDSVKDELSKTFSFNSSEDYFLLALYMLGFEGYKGFSQ
ncbi:MAG: Eco47II family restriction endonuclease [Defluviitaleaceae bacterium]|nr:Eco47II family restriction endonuclease [Defluviitaleaceae bacterium]